MAASPIGRRGAGPGAPLASRSGARTVFLYHLLLGVTWVAVALPLLAWGFEYYRLPLALRPDSPLDALFRPTGLVGNRLGIIGTLMIAGGVAMYTTRKRWGRVQGVGKLRHWLSFHIWLCTLGPFLILLHTSFKVGGIVSIAFWSMVVVVLSGVLGRYVYVHIPKRMNGRFLAMQEIEADQRDALQSLRDAGVPADAVVALGLPEPDPGQGLIQSFRLAVGAGGAGRAAVRRVRSRAAEAGADADAVHGAVEAARRYHRLALGRVVLAPFGRLFRYWHAVHLPLAVLMAVVLLLHIAVAVAFGYGWTSASP